MELPTKCNDITINRGPMVRKTITDVKAFYALLALYLHGVLVACSIWCNISAGLQSKSCFLYIPCARCAKDCAF